MSTRIQTEPSDRRGADQDSATQIAAALEAIRSMDESANASHQALQKMEGLIVERKASEAEVREKAATEFRKAAVEVAAIPVLKLPTAALALAINLGGGFFYGLLMGSIAYGPIAGCAFSLVAGNIIGDVAANDIGFKIDLAIVSIYTLYQTAKAAPEAVRHAKACLCEPAFG